MSYAGDAGTLGTGGTGGQGFRTGGGGGGGYYGGGGGGGACIGGGGGGGSGYGPDGAVLTPGVRSGDGQVTISWTTPSVPVDQTVGFTSSAPGSAKVGGATYTPSASASSGLTVAITVDASASSVCSISAGVVSFTGVGTCVLDANQPGDGVNYNAAPQVQQSFSVGIGDQTILFAALAGRTLAQSPFTVSATASSGLTVTFSSTTPTVCKSTGTNGHTITLLAVGLCTVKADQAGNATYNPAPSVPQSFTVSKANQTITFAALAGRTLVQSPFKVSATASSGLTVTFSSTTPAVCTVSGTTVTLLTTGTCTVQADQAGNGTYNPAPSVPQSFTVSKANQTITFGALKNRKLTQSPFKVNATASSGLTVTFSSTTPAVCTVSGTTVTLLTTGTCTVQADQAGNGTYNPAPSTSRGFTVA